MANWWDGAPLADSQSKAQPSAGANWWDAAPLAQEKAAAPKEPDDRYRAAARKDIDDLKAKGIDTGAGYTRRLIQGATFGGADEVIAAATAPLEMIKRGTFNPIEGYRYAKAREDEILNDSRKQTGLAGDALEIAGGVGSGVGLANAGVSFGAKLAPNASLLARTGAGAADGVALGALGGALEGNTFDERFKGALTGGAIGGAVGGAVPGVVAGARTLAAPVMSNLRARVNPQGYAEGQVARAISESGKTPEVLAREVADAAAAGQPFTLADALGNSGQRMLSTVARAPGEGRTAVTEFLNARQAGQGARVSGAIDEALGADGTARQTAEQLIATARAESKPLYEAALSRKPVWNDRIQQYFDDPITAQGLKEGVKVQRLEALADGKKFDPSDYSITGFNEAGDPIISAVPNMRTINLIKKGWDNILEGYRDSTTGKLVLDEYGLALDSVRRTFLQEVDAVNPIYAKAREKYAGPAQIRDAVNVGREAAGRGRAADNLDRFNSFSDPAKQGFRTGYADKVSEGIERGAEGVNKVRPLTSEKAATELGELSLHQGPVQPGALDPLSQRLSREARMFETRGQALGGSRTADNLADEGAMGIDPSIITNLLSGNVGGTVKAALAAGQRTLTGNTAEVRKSIADQLLMRGHDVSAASLEKITDAAMKRIAKVNRTLERVSAGTRGAIAAAPGVAQR